MENKIFLDSGIMISLGIINEGFMNSINKIQTAAQKENQKCELFKCKGQNYYEFTEIGKQGITKFLEANKEGIKKALQKESINILDQDVENLCELYGKIIKKEVNACVVPVVYKEICLDPTTARAKATKDFFKYCNLALPKINSEDFARQTVALSETFKDVDHFDKNKPDERYGLADDMHNKDEKNVDVNYEDRWLLAETEIMSRLGDEKLAIVSGNDVLTEYITLEDGSKSFSEYAEHMCAYTLMYQEDKSGLNGKELEEIEKYNSGETYLLLHENEKDFGRISNGNRSRKYKQAKEGVRNENLMNDVALDINGRLESSKTVTPDDKNLKNFLSNLQTQKENNAKNKNNKTKKQEQIVEVCEMGA